ncbi:MAG: cytochrome c3 family protein [Phycisphaerae bacterium]|jgi:hypothetical protein
MNLFVFPRWVNHLRVALGLAIVIVPVYVAGVFALAASPQTTDVGYAPVQPVAYSHALHAGELGIDCRYCHTGVETAARASVPPTQTCQNCHAKIRTESDKLVTVRLSEQSGYPVPWIRVHDLPDYVYFDHSAHVRRGVGCVSCHGRVDTMAVVRQVEPLSMGWCLDCHRHPDPQLRPVEHVTDMRWTPASMTVDDLREISRRQVNPSTDCSTCHR